MNTGMLGKTMEKLSSGYRINRAGDDAAGLQLSEKLRAQIRGSQKAFDNTQDGINVLNIADGSLQTITDSLQRIRELAVQASNDTYNTAQRSAMQVEIEQLLTDIDRTRAKA
jgi:flagellin